MKKQQPMTQAQIEALRKAAVEVGPREAAIVAIMTRHFIRVSELAGSDRAGNATGLRTTDVNLKDRTIFIKRLKGSKSDTDSFRDEQETEILGAWLKVKPESQWLFPGRNPEFPMSSRQIENIFKGLANAAGIPATSSAPHATRHTLGQTLAEAGVAAKMIQQCAGHVSLASTGQYFEFRRSVVDDTVKKALGF